MEKKNIEEIRAESLQEKVVLITGASSGLGYGAALGFARAGVRVVMLCRDADRGEKARAAIVRDSGNDRVDLLVADLGDLPGVREAVREFYWRYKRLDVLVNNAGVLTRKRQETVCGEEMVFGVNHLGHYFLTTQILELLVKTPDSRVLVVTSGIHRIGNIDFEDPSLKRNWSPVRAYAQSKLANSLFAFRLARMLKNQGISVHALHPGAVAGRLGVDRESGSGGRIMKMLGPFFQSPERAAVPLVKLGLGPEGGQTTGVYHAGNRVALPPRKVLDTGLQDRLWAMSMERCARCLSFEPYIPEE